MNSINIDAVVHVDQVSDWIRDLEDQGARVFDYSVWPSRRTNLTNVEGADCLNAFIDIAVIVMEE